MPSLELLRLRMFISNFANFTKFPFYEKSLSKFGRLTQNSLHADFSDIPAKDADQNSSQNIGRIVNVKIHP